MILILKRAFELFEQRVAGVFVAQEGLVGGDAPVDAEAAVQDTDATVGLWGVEVVALVLENCVLAEHGKTVGKAFWNEELAVVVFSEFDCYVLAVGGTATADIYRNVKNSALYTSYKFALCERRQLEVEATEHTIVAAGFVVLYEVDVQSGLLLEFAGIEALEKISAGVTENLRLNDKYAFYFCFDYFHF